MIAEIIGGTVIDLEPGEVIARDDPGEIYYKVNLNKDSDRVNFSGTWYAAINRQMGKWPHSCRGEEGGYKLVVYRNTIYHPPFQKDHPRIMVPGEKIAVISAIDAPTVITLTQMGIRTHMLGEEVDRDRSYNPGFSLSIGDITIRPRNK